MSFTRRDFFKTVTLASASIYVSRMELLKAAIVTEKFHLVSANLQMVSIRDLLKNEMYAIPVTASGHDFFQHPIKSNLIYTVPKYEKRISLIDFKQKKEIDLIKVHDKEFIFYGHIAFSSDGTKFYSPQVNEKKGFGTIVIYDSKTNRPIETMGHLVGGAHDTQFLSDNKTLIVTSSGLKNGVRVEPSSLNLFDTTTKKLIKKYTCDNPAQKLGHLRILPSDEIIALTSPVDKEINGVSAKCGVVYSNLGDNKLEKLKEWKISSDVFSKMSGEVLSSSLDISKNELIAHWFYILIHKNAS
jgi:hypothetical protein